MSSKNRSIRNRVRKNSKEPIQLELNSLLDVLVILLVFLIKNYTSSEVDLAIPKNLIIPESISQSIVHKGITIQISKELDVTIEDKKIVTISSKIRNGDFELIRNELSQLRDKIERIEMESSESKPFSGVVNLMMDRDLKFDLLKKIMDTSTEVGFEQFKFIVIES